MLDAFFFPSADGTPLLGVWREAPDARRVWILAPPFAEEEKSARRTLTEIARALQNRGESSLVFSFRGTGDSAGNFADATFDSWRQDLCAALAQATSRAPHASTSVGVLGVRLGASLALLEREALGARGARLVLIEPLLVGRSFLTQQLARKKMRAQMTGGDASQPETDADDLDGWPLSPAMRADFTALDVREVASYPDAHVVQVGPRAEIAPPLEAFAAKIGASAHVVQMPAFWNLLDYTPPTPLLSALEVVWNG